MGLKYLELLESGSVAVPYLECLRLKLMRHIRTTKVDRCLLVGIVGCPVTDRVDDERLVAVKVVGDGIGCLDLVAVNGLGCRPCQLDTALRLVGSQCCSFRILRSVEIDAYSSRSVVLEFSVVVVVDAYLEVG